MPIFEGSRYAGVEFTAIRGKDLRVRKWLHPSDPFRFASVSPDWVIHEVKSGDILDLIAYIYTGKNADKARLWWMIAEVNNILFPLDIEPGIELAIPLRELNDG